jgi:solute:Na+ symporter, SSS family
MVLGVTDIHFLYVAPILFAASVILIVAISLFTKTRQEREDIEAFLWTKKSYNEETRELSEKPWYQNYRIQSVIILSITALIIIMFW